jgi:anti-sigma B factor antagonist
MSQQPRRYWFFGVRRSGCWDINQMRIKTQDYNEVTVVELQGELDGDASGQLRNTITDIVVAGKTGIVIHASGVGFIDSEGLGLLLWIKNYCGENKCQLRMAGLDENCSKILEITCLDKEFDLYAELAEAVKSFV